MEHTRTIQYDDHEDMVNHINEMEQSGSWAVQQIVPLDRSVSVGNLSAVVQAFIVVYRAVVGIDMDAEV